ncbi:CIA30 family protein [Polaribacter sp. M15]
MNKLPLILIFILGIMQLNNQIIFNFSKDADLSLWRVVDDVVMGGISRGNIKIDSNGNGVYFGKVSLENNGGFSSLRYRFNQINVSKFSKVILRIKGDGKNYQFRIKDKLANSYSYIKVFETSGEWERIEVNLAEMYPAFRGRKLDIPNFSSDVIDEIALLIGNKKEQNFQLEIDKIYLE